MTLLVLEISDGGIRVWDEAGVVVMDSPGFAVLGGTGVQAIGAPARAQARLQPAAVNDRFWDELSLEPLGTAAGAVATSADLAHEHLQTVWSQVAANAASEVLLAVPGTYGRDQLALVLGIARECDVPVVGMLDSALAAVSRGAAPGRAQLHVEVHQYRAVVTRFSSGEQLSRAGVESTAGGGLREIRERWLAAISNRFVEVTRFDPLHQAEHEQHLFGQLTELPERLAREPRLLLEVAAHAAPVDLQLLAEAAQSYYDRLAELVSSAMTPGEAVMLQLSTQAAQLPGLAQRLGELPGVEPQVLPADAVARGALALVDAVRRSATDGDGVPFLTQALWNADGEAAAPTVRLASAPLQVPTHVVYEGTAVPLSTTLPVLVGSAAGAPDSEERRITLGAPLRGVSRRHCKLQLSGHGTAEVTDTSSHGTWLNGRRIDGTVEVHPGDRLRLGTPGHELLMVRVVK